MSVEVRPARREDVIGTLRPVFHYFGREPTKENADRFARVLDPQRMHAAWEDGEIVGGAGAFDFRLTIPGNTVPAAGVTVVGVLPTHRRRGVLTQLMRAQLDDIHERGEALAALWASEGGIYGRFGYGLAALCGEIDLLRVYSRFHRPIEPLGEFRDVFGQVDLQTRRVVQNGHRPSSLYLKLLGKAHVSPWRSRAWRSSASLRVRWTIDTERSPRVFSMMLRATSVERRRCPVIASG